MPPRPADSDRGVLDDGTEFDLCVVGLRVGGGLMSGSGREMGKDRGAGRRRFIRREWVVFGWGHVFSYDGDSACPLGARAHEALDSVVLGVGVFFWIWGVCVGFFSGQKACRKKLRTIIRRNKEGQGMGTLR